MLLTTLPIVFPHPEEVSIEIDGLKIQSLPSIIELKLAAGMDNVRHLRHLGDVPPPDQRRRFLDLQVVHLVALLAADDEHVPEPARREQPDAARLALDHDVRAERRAVHGLRDRGPRREPAAGRTPGAAGPSP